jgi:hypothetical protein
LEDLVKIFKTVLFALAASAVIGCGTQPNTNIANGTANLGVPAANVNKAEAVPTVAADAPVGGSLATPSEAYRTAYAIRETKDVAAMKKVMSKDVIEFLSMIAEEEKSTLDAEVAKMFDKPQARSNETRNEKIVGENAYLEYLDEKGNWRVMDFVKEGAEWKLTLPSKDTPEPGSTDKKSKP